MTHLARLTAALLAASALPAAALDFGSGFSLTGDIEAEYFSIESDDGSFGFVDLTLSWRSQGSGAVTYGFDLTNDRIINLDDGDDASVFWFSAVLGTSYGEFAIGRPRPLHDTMFDTPDVAAAGVLGIETLSFSDSLAVVFALSEGEGVDIWGATFKGESGDLTYGAGLHSFSEGGSSGTIYEFVAKYQLGATEIYGGLEIGGGEFEDLSKVLVGASYSADKWSVGAKISSFDSFGDTGSNATLYGEYLVLDALTVGVQYQRIDAGGNDANIYGLSGIYTTGSGAFAELGVARLDSGSSDDDTLATASIGFRF